MRRGGAEELAARARDDAYRTLLRPFFDAVPEGSCVAIDIEGERFADVRADLPVIPASNQKLLVAAVALEVLGEDHRFHTELRGAQPVDGVITGDVYLVGGGDPLLVTGDYVDPLPLPGVQHDVTRCRSPTPCRRQASPRSWATSSATAAATTTSSSCRRGAPSTCSAPRPDRTTR